MNFLVEKLEIAGYWK